MGALRSKDDGTASDDVWPLHRAEEVDEERVEEDGQEDEDEDRSVDAHRNPARREGRKAQKERQCKYPHVEGQKAYEQPGDEGEELRDSVEPVDPAVAGEVLDVELELFAGDPA